MPTKSRRVERPDNRPAIAGSMSSEDSKNMGAIADTAEATVRKCVDRNARVLVASLGEQMAHGVATSRSRPAVRVVYAMPSRAYLSLEPRDHRPALVDPMDVTGWDISVFLPMLRDSSPIAFEVLGTRPTIAHEEDSLRTLTSLAGSCLCPRTLRDGWADIAGNALAMVWENPNPKAIDLIEMVRATACAAYVSDKLLPPPASVSTLANATGMDAQTARRVDALIQSRRISTHEPLVGRDRTKRLVEWVEATLSSARERDVPSREPIAWKAVDDAFLSMLR